MFTLLLLSGVLTGHDPKTSLSMGMQARLTCTAQPAYTKLRRGMTKVQAEQLLRDEPSDEGIGSVVRADGLLLREFVFFEYKNAGVSLRFDKHTGGLFEICTPGRTIIP